MTDTLPPLPEPDVMWVDGKDQWGYDDYSHAYSEEAMRAYRAEGVAAMRAEVAEMRAEVARLTEICQALHDRLLRGDDDRALIELAAEAWQRG